MKMRPTRNTFVGEAADHDRMFAQHTTGHPQIVDQHRLEFGNRTRMQAQDALFGSKPAPLKRTRLFLFLVSDSLVIRPMTRLLLSFMGLFLPSPFAPPMRHGPQ